jgi:acyl-CoA synthetase (AMP-forming)/AMP-acid ligase II
VILGRRPDPARMAATIAAERPTAVWGGSPQLVRGMVAALEAGDVDATSVRVVVYGWGALDPSVLETLTRLSGGRARAMGIFGQTEAIACHRFWPDRHVETYRRTAPAVNYVGVPHPLLASMVVDLDGADLVGEPGTPGEAVYRSPAVAHGYYRDPDATREAFRDGWFHSGDSCAYDADGLRVMVDRYKDIIKTGGENVSSLRVESVLHQHPAVAQAAVIGLPHDHWGEAVTAVVVPAPGATVDADEVIAFARERLAGFETPKHLVVIDALPVTVGGKVLKYKLRAAHADLYARGS